jgi:hypothetical protein
MIVITVEDDLDTYVVTTVQRIVYANRRVSGMCSRHGAQWNDQ